MIDLIDEKIPTDMVDYRSWYYMEENFKFETWLPIIYNDIKEGFYEISDYGRVRRSNDKRLLSPAKKKDGYLALSLSANNSKGRKSVSIHRLVATAFVKNDNVKENIEVNHINGNKMDNRVKNLEWCNRSYNTKHAVDMGLKPILKGSEIGNSTLKENDVRIICDLLLKYDGCISKVLSHVTRIGIATTYDAIIAIKIKQNWSWLSDEYFVKDYFSMKYEKMITDICFSLIKHSGDSQSVYEDLKDIYPNISLTKIRNVRNKGTAVKISDKIFPKGIFDRKQEVIDMEKNNVTKEMLDMYTKAWSHGHPLIDDDDYDMLVEEYVKEHGEEARPFMRVKKPDGIADAPNQTLSKVYGVTTPMRPNQKTYEDWVNSLRKNPFMEPNVHITVQPKYDGCSTFLDMESGKYFTRGDYDNGESMDVTELFKETYIEYWNLMPNKHMFDDLVAVKFEAIMAEEVFKEMGFNKMYVNARAATSAIIMSRNKEAAQYINLIPLRFYFKDGSIMIPHNLEWESIKTAIDDYEGIQGFIDTHLENGATAECAIYLDADDNPFHYAIDGVVVSVNDITEIAIKILNNVKETKIKAIEWQMGKTGKITPVGILEPVTFDNGVTVDHVGLSTFERVYDLDLHFDETVRVMHNIVPYLLDGKGDGSMRIPMPDKCPVCGHPLDMRNLKTIRCTNPECQSKKLGDIIRYCETMKMMGVSKGILTKLYELGYVKSIPDLYKIDGNALALEKGFAETSVASLLHSIKVASKNVPVERWFGALPCLNISQKTWKTIFDTRLRQDEGFAGVLFSLLDDDRCEEFLQVLVEPIVGIGPATWGAIVEGFRNNWNDIRETASHVRLVVNIQKSTKGKVCLSGTRDKLLMKILEEEGYEVTTDWSSDVTTLLIPDNDYRSSKVKKALRNNIPIMTVEVAILMLTQYHDLLSKKVEVVDL